MTRTAKMTWQRYSSSTTPGLAMSNTTTFPELHGLGPNLQLTHTPDQRGHHRVGR